MSLPPLIDSFERCRAGFLDLSDGARMRYAVMDPERPAHATIVVAPGRREFIEKKYFEMGPELLARGFRLIFMEWRGQGLSTRFLTGTKFQRDHARDFNQHIEDFQLFHDKILRPNRVGKVVLSGHSMGSHLLLRWMIEASGIDIAGLIMVAPMMALAGPLAHASAHFLSWSSTKLGLGEEYAAMQHDYSDEERAFAGNPLSHDPQRFAILDQYFTAYPQLAVGGVTWDWLQAAIKSMYSVQRRIRMERVRIPVLTLIGNEDRVTPPDEVVRYIKMLPQAETILVPGARHDVMNEVDACRDEAWSQIDRYLKKILS